METLFLTTPWTESPVKARNQDITDVLDVEYPDILHRYRIDPISGRPISFSDTVATESELKQVGATLDADVESGSRVAYYQEQWPDGMHYFAVTVSPNRD